MKASFCVEIGLGSKVETADVRAKAEEIEALLDLAGVAATVEPVHYSKRSDNSPAIQIVAANQYQLRAALEAVSAGWTIPPDWGHRQGIFPLVFFLRVDTDTK